MYAVFIIQTIEHIFIYIVLIAVEKNDRLEKIQIEALEMNN